eukprot:scaffold6781_cov204-Amphora_coffeaeformis.AAC.4
MEEVGTSVTLTTLTSALAFGLGCLSSIPAVYWLCLYALPTIVFVYIYQMTFFVAVIVLDEKRIADNRRDCCTCFVVKQKDSDNEDDDEGNKNNGDTNEVNASIAEEMEISRAEEKATAEEKEDVPNALSTEHTVRENKGKGDDDNSLPTAQPANPNFIEHFIKWSKEFLVQPVVKATVGENSNSNPINGKANESNAEENATPVENEDDPNPLLSKEHPVLENKGEGNDDNSLLTVQSASDRKVDTNIIEHFIEWYAEFLMRPVVKAVVVVVFVALAGLCAWSASQLTQFFDVADVMPEDSYATAYIRTIEEYSNTLDIAPHVYFRFVDQSLPSVQEQMKAFVNDLVKIEAVPSRPRFFWLNDFEIFVQANNATVGSLPFNDQLDKFLAIPEYRILYSKHIARDPTTRNILTSRVRMSMNNIDLGNVEEAVDTFKDQSRVTDAQEVNRGKDEYPFFVYHDIFQIWAFYLAVPGELIQTTILGVTTVTGIALLLVPHWTAALFVLPLICMLYVDLLGIMQWGGVHIDPVSYVTSVMSIGLLVDFILHVLLRYYECPGNRHEKTVGMLKSMGSSILTGGISTFLGTLPLAFSTSVIFQTIFIAFLGLSTLGVGHGLILLPVVLSIIGPEDQVVRSAPNASSHGFDEKNDDKKLHEDTADAYSYDTNQDGKNTRRASF